MAVSCRRHKLVKKLVPLMQPDDKLSSLLQLATELDDIEMVSINLQSPTNISFPDAVLNVRGYRPFIQLFLRSARFNPAFHGCKILYEVAEASDAYSLQCILDFETLISPIDSTLCSGVLLN